MTSTKQFAAEEERDGSGSVVRQFFEDGEIIGGNSYFFAQDHIGSIRTMTNSAGTIQAAYAFDPFGRKILAVESVASDYQYAGMFVHQRSAFNITLFRAYSPNLSTWLSRDPASKNGGRAFNYADNNPISLTDSLGLESMAGGYAGSYAGGYAGSEAERPCGGSMASTMNNSMAGGMAESFASHQSTVGLYTLDQTYYQNLCRENAAQFKLKVGLVTLGGAVVVSSLGLLTIGGGTLAVTSGAGGAVLPASIVRLVPTGAGAGIVNLAKAETLITGNEHALVRLQNGARALVSGGPGGICFGNLPIQRIIFHTHPFQTPPTGPSAADQAALKALKQVHSYILEHGQVIRFGP